VLTPEIASLIRQSPIHYAGTFSDVLRLAVPPRHAATEAAGSADPPPLPDHPAGPLVEYPTGAGYLDAIRTGRSAAGHVAGHPEHRAERRLGGGPGQRRPGLRRERPGGR
jgi:hypothetical protein